jgi:hypothetical protein
VTDQIYPPKRPNMAHFKNSDEPKTDPDVNAEFSQLLDDYRNRYVLRPRPEEKPAP